MAAPCPRCGSEIRDSEVSVDDASAPDAAGRLEVAACLCCGAVLARPGPAAVWEVRQSR